MHPRPWPVNFRPSAWNDPLDAVAAGLMPHYNAGVRRSDLGAVEELFARFDGPRPEREVVVVGTNGKTSVATLLSRALTAAGVATGLYTSPHLRSWTERIRLGEQPVSDALFEEELLRWHAAARDRGAPPGDLRFFDVLTLAARAVFARGGVRVGIYEAGIGGRLDATRVLGPDLVLLTSIGSDHEELLGRAPEERLEEKARVTPPGATLLSARLGEALEARLAEIAASVGFEPRFAPAPTNVALVRAAFEWLLPGAAFPAISEAVEGRFQAGVKDGVAYVVDVAHNPSAWAAFLGDLPGGPHVALAAITQPRPPDELVAALSAARAKLSTVVVTNTAVRPSQPPEAIAAGLADAGIDAVAEPDPRQAFALAAGLARERAAPLAVFGSTYLALDFLSWAEPET